MGSMLLDRCPFSIIYLNLSLDGYSYVYKRRYKSTLEEKDKNKPAFQMKSFLLTKLQDLPIEILDFILMKAVVKKVMEKKLAKSAWVEYTSQVIWPLRTVSLQWDYRLTTNWFKIVLCRNLMRKGRPTYSTI